MHLVADGICMDLLLCFIFISFFYTVWVLKSNLAVPNNIIRTVFANNSSPQIDRNIEIQIKIPIETGKQQKNKNTQE